MVRSLLLVSVAFLLAFSSSAQNKSYNLNAFTKSNYQEISKNIPVPGFSNAKRYRELSINPTIQKNESIRINDTILLDLFDDKHYKVYIDNVDIDVNGTLTIRARFPDSVFGYFLISTSGGKSLITIEVPDNNELFMSRYDQLTDKYYLLEIDKSKQDYLEENPPVIPPDNDQLKNKSKKKSQKNTTDFESNLDSVISDSSIAVNDGVSKDENSPVEVTVMIVYTPAAMTWAAANETNINNTISLLMAKAQLALDNSSTLLTVKLVHSELVNYTELNSLDDLYNLRNTNDGFMDNIHNLRNTYCADLVVLLENISYTGGQGFLLTSTSGSPDYAFSLSRVQQVSWTYTTIHEIGHNLGCHHHKLQKVDPGPGLFTYSAGWRWTGTGNVKYCSIMTYDGSNSFEDGINTIRVAYFSNPGIQYQGVATGDATDGDNARTIRQIKSVVTAYRDDCYSPPMTPIGNNATNVYQTSFTARWSNSASASGYRLDVATDAGFISFVSGFNDRDVKNVTSYNISGLSAKTTYYYRIRAYNISGTSSSSETIKVTTLTNPSSSPSGLTAVSCYRLVTLIWRKSIGPDFLRYRIYGGTLNNPTQIIDSTSNGISDTSKVISGLTRGQTYYFRIKAVNYDGLESDFSNQSATTVKTGVVPKIRIKWGEVLICSNLGDSIKSYQWYKNDDMISNAIQQYYVTNKKSGTYKVETIDKDGCKNSSNTVSVSGSKSLSVFPNPASASFNLNLNNESEDGAVITIFKLTGIKVLEFRIENMNDEVLKEIPVSNIDEGIYIVQVLLDNKDMYYTKIVVIK